MLSGLLLRARRAAKRLPEAGREHNDFTAMAETAELGRADDGGAGPPLGNRCCACAQSGDLALEGCISSLTGSLPLGHEGRGQASPVVHSWQPRSKARGPG